MKRNHIILTGVSAGIIALYILLNGQFKDNLINHPLKPTVIKDDSVNELLTRNNAMDGNPNASLQNQVNLLSIEVSELKRTVTALNTELRILASTRKANVTAVSADPMAERQKVEEMRIQATEHQHEQGEQLELSFHQQTTDPDWSSKTKSLIQEALTGDKVAAESIIDIDCRATMCRIELSDDDQHRMPKFSAFPLKIGQELPNIMVDQHTESDGSTTTVMYLSKDDFALPDSGNSKPKI